MLDCNHISEVLATSFLESLSPTRCVACDEPGMILCAKCAAELPFIDVKNACPHCGAPYGHMICTECPPPDSEHARMHPEDLFPFVSARAALSYEKGTKRIVRTYKDGDELRLDMVIASFVCQAMRGRAHSRKIQRQSMVQPRRKTLGAPDDWTLWADAIVAIPASPDAVARRGFDHMSRVAKLCSAWTGLPLIEALVYKKRTLDQRALGKGQRRMNSTGSFAAASGVGRMPAKIILIDDVLTTGATATAATNALVEAGARDIAVAVCARVW